MSVAVNKNIDVNNITIELNEYRVKEGFYGKTYVKDSATKVEPIV